MNVVKPTTLAIAGLCFAAALHAGCGSEDEAPPKGTASDASSEDATSEGIVGNGGSGGMSCGSPTLLSCPSALDADAAGCPAPPVGISGDAGPPFAVGCSITSESSGCLGTHCDCKPGDPPFWYCLL